MSEIKKMAEGLNYTAAEVDNLNEFEGKVFLKDMSGATATEISITSLAPGAELPFFHTHKKNEETYIIIKGSGNFQIDDDVIAIHEGSIIRVATKGRRSMRNTSNVPMTYFVVQAKENSLEEYGRTDGEMARQEKKW